MTEPELNNLVGERSSLSVALDAIPLELIPRSQAVIPALERWSQKVQKIKASLSQPELHKTLSQLQESIFMFIL